jgi:hypothetical protein
VGNIRSISRNPNEGALLEQVEDDTSIPRGREVMVSAKVRLAFSLLLLSSSTFPFLRNIIRSLHALRFPYDDVD